MPESRILRLLGKIVSRGKYTSSGPDFQRLRNEALEQLAEFVPSEFSLPSRVKNPLMRYWAGQAAFLKDCQRPKAAHLLLPSSRLHYIRIPRAASTALSYALLSAKYPRLSDHLSASQINFLSDANLERNIISVHADDLYFTVVRNPFTRLVSVYRQFFEHCENEFMYADYLFGIFRKEMSFAEFVATLRDIPNRWKDQHFRPQSDLLKAYRLRDVPVSVFKLEEPLPLQHFLSQFEIVAHPRNQSDRVYDYRDYYDEQSFHLASDVYRSDIRLFGYEQSRQELEAWIQRKMVRSKN